jgi:phosphatidylinositol glycan class C protein
MVRLNQVRALMPANVRSYTYWNLVLESGVISQHLSSIVVFIAVFMFLYDNAMGITTLLVTGNALSVAGCDFGTTGGLRGCRYWSWDNMVRDAMPNFHHTRTPSRIISQ